MLSPMLWLVLSTLLASAPHAVPSAADAPTTETVLTGMSAAIKGLKTLRCNAKATERLASGYQRAASTMKVAYAPLRIYVRNDQGVEVLWVQGQNGGDALVNPGKFPYVTVSLNPNGTLMRRSQHHSVLDAGYGTIADLIRSSPQRSEAFRNTFRYVGDTTVQGRSCYLVRSDFPQFRYVSYKTQPGETVSKVAERFGCGEFRIVERNKVDYLDPLPAGTVLQVPNAYGRRTILSVDQKTMLPVSVAVWDDKGLFESFEFSQVVANQPIPAAEFTKDFKGYKF